MTISLRYLLASAFLCCLTAVGAQYEAVSLQTTPPLSLSKMASASTSSDGFWWAGTGEGLFRLDGSDALQVLIDDELTNSQNIQSPMFEDGRGLLWFSNPEALLCYNPLFETVEAFQIEANGLPVTKDYRPFYFDPDQQELWLRAGDRLWAYQVEEHTHRPLTQASEAICYQVKQLGPDHFRISGARWMFKGVELFDVKAGSNSNPARMVATQEVVRSVYQLSADSILLGTSRGLKLLTLSGGEENLKTFPARQRGTNINGIHPIGPARLLIAQSGHSVAVLDLKQGEFVATLGKANGLSPASIDRLFPAEGNQVLLTNDPGGIDLLLPANPLFQVSHNGPQSPVRSVSLDGAGGGYVLTHDWRVEPLTTASDQAQRSINLTALPGFSKNELSIGSILWKEDSLFIETGTQLWAFPKGATSASPQAKKASSWSQLLSSNKQDKLLLTEHGIRSFELGNDSIRLAQVINLPPEEKYLFVQAFALKDESILINHLDRNILRLRKTGNTFTTTNEYSFPGELKTVLLTQDNRLFVGGNEGLFVLQKDTLLPWPPLKDRPLTFDVRNLAEDTRGNLWLGTPNGLFAYNGEGKQLAYFSTSDGLPSNRFIGRVNFTDAQGRIHFATEAGIVSFAPQQLLNHHISQTAYCAEILINEIPLETDTATTRLTQIKTDYRHNSLKFKVAGTGYSDPELSRVRFQLLGHDEQPDLTPFNSFIRYSNLPAGKYTLVLEGINQNGRVTPGQRIQIEITPPFTQTWPFYLLCALSALLLGFSTVFWVRRQEQKRQARLLDQQARLAAERDRIAGEVHDDLGGQISSILYLSEEVLLMGKDDEDNYPLQRINELSRNSLQNVRDIIFALDNRRASLADFGEQLRSAGTDFFRDHNIAFSYTDSFAQPDFTLSSRQKRNLILITKEAWHNTVKHAEATQTTLKISEEEGVLKLVYADNGKGFATTRSEKATGGYGVDNMAEKASAIGATTRLESTPGEGTKLHLHWQLPANQKQRNP